MPLKKDDLYTQNLENTSQPRSVSKYWILNIEPSVSMSVELRGYKIRVVDQQNQEYDRICNIIIVMSDVL